MGRASFVPEQRLRPGDTYAERYRIDELLGRGGMGEVWSAHDMELGRPIALKLIKREYAELPDYAKRFRREMKAVAKLRHPGIVKLYNAGQGPDGRLYMDMERIDGITVREAIDTSRRLDLVSALFYTIQVADALEAAHCAGVHHRDIKPENVMVEEDGRAHTLDFGIAVDINRASTGRGERGEEGERGLMVGTVEYMAPELVRDRPVDHRADIYALGVMLYEMVTGQRPYGRMVEKAGVTRRLAAHVYDEPVPFVQLVPELPMDLWEVTKKLLAKEPEDRYGRAEEVVVALHQVLVMHGTPKEHPAARQVAREQLDMERRKAFAHKAREKAPSNAGSEREASVHEVSTQVNTAPMPAGFVATRALPAGFAEPERTTLELPEGYRPPPEQSPFRLATSKIEGRAPAPATLRSAPSSSNAPTSSTSAVTAPVSFVAPRRETKGEGPHDQEEKKATATRSRFAKGLALGVGGGGAVVALAMMALTYPRTTATTIPTAIPTAIETRTATATATASETPTAIPTASASASASAIPTTSASAKVLAKPLAPKPKPTANAAADEEDAPPKRRRIF